MKAQKYFHPTFGRGLALIDDEIRLLYEIDPGMFCLLFTFQSGSVSDCIAAIERDMTLGTAHIDSLENILLGFTDNELAAIYKEVVGYDPFEEDAATARDLVIDYFNLEEARKEIF